MIVARAVKYGDNVDTDVIIPARYLNISDMKELAEHCMEDIDVNYFEKIKNGAVIIAGKNFGCGSSREHAPIVIKESGVKIVIAETFARIFYRNAINIGLAIIECHQAAREINEGDVIKVDIKNGVIINKTTFMTYKINAFPEFMQKIIDAGGLVEYVKKKVE